MGLIGKPRRKKKIHIKQKKDKITRSQRLTLRNKKKQEEEEEEKIEPVYDSSDD